MSPMEVRRISTAIVKAHPPLEGKDTIRIDLASWDLAMLSVHHIQKGLLFFNPPASPIPLVDRLKDSLSIALSAFYPLAGRLVTESVLAISPTHNTQSRVFIECNGDTGAEFIHAEVDMSISDVTSPLDVPDIVKSFFPYSGAVNHDGHSIPLLAVQITQLRDGVFIGLNFNHSVGDGTSFWAFFNSWAAISAQKLSSAPINQRCFLDLKPPLLLPFSRPDQFIQRYSPIPLRERMFHFSPDSMKQLKRRANAYRTNTIETSSFQALSALVWRAITRARRFPSERKTTCRLAANNRTRLNPPLPEEYFGNCIQTVGTTTTTGQLMSLDLGWAARLLYESVASHNDTAARKTVAAWAEARSVYYLTMFDPCSIMMGSSPRFDMYGCEFGWGKAVAARSGYANKFDGKVSAYPGREGGGSVDLEICLPAETMGLIEVDEEFMEFVSVTA